jgi:hypothetical protein
MRRVVIISLTVFLFASLATAQVPTAGNVFFGYSYYNSDLSSTGRANANGWEGSLEGRLLPWIGAVVDFSGHYGSQNFIFCPPGPGPCGPASVNFNVHNVLLGPRVSVSVSRFRPFAEALFGFGHINANAAGKDTAFATALGGGLDYRLIRPVAWRFQGDYVHTRFFGTRQDNARLSTGIVLRF